VLQMTLVAVGAPSSFASREADLAVRLALCSTQINPEQISVVVGPTDSTISAVLNFLIVANGPFTPLVIEPASSLVSMLQNCLPNKEKASDVLGLDTADTPPKSGIVTMPQYTIAVPQSPAPSPTPATSPPSQPSPPSTPDDACPTSRVITLSKGWQMISFQYLCEGEFTVIQDSVGWKVNDKIIARQGSLKIATYDGTKWQGELVKTGLFFKSGYKVYHKVSDPITASGPVLTQTCANQNPVKNIALAKGWNWMGNPKLGCTTVTGPSPDFQTVGDAQFSVKNKGDEMKNRGKAGLTLNKWDGSQWQGNINKLLTGEGYEIKVENAVTVTFGN